MFMKGKRKEMKIKKIYIYSDIQQGLRGYSTDWCNH